MMNTRIVSGAAAALLIFGLGGAARAASPETPANGWEKYKVLSERNIFLLERSSGARRPFAERTTPTYSPEHYLLLTGIVRQAQEYVAFLEDTRSRAVERVRTDGRVAQGRIARIELDYIEYEANGQTTKVELGKTLEGGDAARVATSGAPVTIANPSGASQPAAAISASTGEDAAAVLERLRQKRLSELNKK